MNGSVVDQDGNPISGVTIKVLGTNEATSTDQNGNFNASAREGAILEIRMIGYKSYNCFS